MTRPILLGLWCALGAAAAAGCGREAVDLLVPRGGPDAGVEGADPKDSGAEVGPAPQEAGVGPEASVGAEAGPDASKPDSAAPCLSDDDCSMPEGVCDTATGRCVECTVMSRSECFFGCNPNTQTCIDLPCRTQNDCPEAFFTQCEPERGVCVQCLADSDCEWTLAGTVANRCREGWCVECVDDGDCGADAPSCLQLIGRCYECLDLETCGEGRVCGLDLRCHDLPVLGP